MASAKSSETRDTRTQPTPRKGTANKPAKTGAKRPAKPKDHPHVVFTDYAAI